MSRLVFGAILGVLVACPAATTVVMTVVATLVSQPAVLAFAAGVLLWPRITAAVRGWTA
jgi:hypothetical protein